MTAEVLTRYHGVTGELELLAAPDDPDALARRLRKGWELRTVEDVRAELHPDDVQLDLDAALALDTRHDPEEVRP